MKTEEHILEFIPDYNIRNISSPEEMLLFDIETTGLKKEITMVYLIGCVYFKNGNWVIRQYLAQSALEEEEILEAFISFSENFKTLVHFNGDKFDIPYIAYKSEYYGLDFSPERFLSFDIYKSAKTARKLLGAESMSQKAIEEFLGIYRDDKLNGGLLIPYYLEYEKNRDQQLEVFLLLHNFDDLQGMLKILPVLSYTEIIKGGFSFLSVEEFDGTAIFNFKLDNNVPVHVENLAGTKDIKDIGICIEKDLLQFNVKIYKTEGRFPIPDYENYYYLPMEDKVIHKDLACFVDRDKRRKATKCNCFIKKTGQFIPQNKVLFEPAFLCGKDIKRTYFEFEKVFDESAPEKLKLWAQDIISGC